MNAVYLVYKFRIEQALYFFIIFFLSEIAFLSLQGSLFKRLHHCN